MCDKSVIVIPKISYVYYSGYIKISPLKRLPNNDTSVIIKVE